jgi:serine/threonine-protein kinase RsbT
MTEANAVTRSVPPSCLPFSSEVDPIWCSRRCAELARSIGFASEAASAIAIAVSELVTNALKFSGGGTVVARPIDEPLPGIEIVVVDDGPWVGEVDAARIDGYSEGRILVPDDLARRPRGRGVGLGAVERLMDELAIEEAAGGGVRVSARKWLPAS